MQPTVYLIHFDKPIYHAKHYLGYSALESVNDRLLRHKAGNGARLLQVCNERDVDYIIVRTWECDDARAAKALERKLKDQHNSPRLCPKCNHTIRSKDNE